MPVVGFIDDTGARVRFAELLDGAGAFAGLPRPVLRAFAAGYRPADHYGSRDVISVTTLANPVQATRLIERHELYVEPLRNMWAVFGTIGHGMYEGHAGPDDISERRLVIDFEGQLVGGTFDLLELIDGERVGRDYKITSSYKVKLMLEQGAVAAALDYVMQANVYRYMLTRPDAQEVVQHESGLSSDLDGPRLVPFEHAGIGDTISRWQLVAWSRDWTLRKDGKTHKPIEIVEIPLISAERVESYIRQRVTLYAAAGMCDDAGLPACSRDETWQGKRCASWCDAAPVCMQLKRAKR